MTTKINYNWTQNYNDRRYSKPWIGVYDRAERKISFGEYIGDWQGGVLTIDAKEGDVVRVGQKDNRSNKGTDLWFEVIDGKLVETTKIDVLSK